MSRTITFYLDSGANIHSCNKQTFTLEELHMTEEEWDSMSEEEKESLAKEISWEKMEWGWYENE